MRKRELTALALAAVIALGLASRMIPRVVETLGKYPGDALWAIAVSLGWMLVFPRWSVWFIAGVAFATSCLVEISQLYHAPWIDSIRKTALGHCFLGSTFAWRDIVAYGAGIVIFAGCAAAFSKQTGTKQ
ncbi:MAG: DUF2809 domain-containing protein [Kiritimatiellaeota bacterium]|nr:DUF2809 domain-containing protein [Kiritimatiellota bacterium]